MLNIVRFYYCTVCPRSNYQFYIVSYYINWVSTSWTYSTFPLSVSFYIITGSLNVYLPINKCLLQIKLLTSLHTCASNSKVSLTVSTMVYCCFYFRIGDLSCLCGSRSPAPTRSGSATPPSSRTVQRSSSFRRTSTKIPQQSTQIPQNYAKIRQKST